MALNNEFLTDILGKEDVSFEDKITKIIAEHEADTRGLVQKRDELFGKLDESKKKIDAFTSAQSEYETKIAGLEETLKKAATDKESSAEYWKAQNASELKKRDDEIIALKEKYCTLEGSYYKKLENEAIHEAIKDLHFMDGLQNGFIYTVLAQNKFEPKEIDGQIMFLNSANKSISEVVKDFALTAEGKAFLKNLNSGGGAKSTPAPTVTPAGNGKVITMAQYEELRKDPVTFQEFREKNRGWSIQG